MQLTKFTDYSLRCLIYLSGKQDSYISVKHMSEYYNISYQHLTKVVHTLSLLGYVESKKGKNGGVKIANKVTNVRLGDLVVELEPNRGQAGIHAKLQHMFTYPRYFVKLNTIRLS